MNKLFRQTSWLPVLGSLLILAASGNALADGRHDGRNAGYNSGRNHHWGWDRSFNDRSPRFDRNDYRHSPRYNNIHDSWAVSLNLGSWYTGSGIRYGTGGYTGFGYGISGRQWYGYSSYRSPAPVVVTRPTVVYVNDYSAPAGHVIHSDVISRPAHSLLRDIYGNCYDRSYDSRGNEIRRQLPESSCRF